MDEIQEGRELDAKIATQVMGKTNVGCESNTEFVPHMDGTNIRRVRVPLYSTDMAAAWEVVERFVADGFSVEVLTHSDLVRPVSVAIYEPRGRLRRQGRAHELTAPLAICLAALKALAATSQPASPPEPTGLFSPMLEPTE